MTLALQLILVYPFLRRAQQRLGVEGFVVISALMTIASVHGLRALGADYAISGFVGCRLLECAIGLTIGASTSPGARGWPRPSALMAVLVALAMSAIALPELLLRNALVPVLVLLAVGVGRNPSGKLGRWAGVGGGLTFVFYLSHSPWAKPILASLAGRSTPVMETALAGCLSLTVAILIAWVFRISFVRVGRRLGPSILRVWR